MSENRAYLYLEDGTVIEGTGFGASTHRYGELVFSTSMNGYPESMTDPSYKGQVLIFTHPLIGNYGIPDMVSENGILENFESEGIKTEGIVVSEATSGRRWNGKRTLDEWMRNEGIPGISGIDTRELTKRIREGGVLSCVISNAGRIEDPFMDLSRKYDTNTGLIGSVSIKKAVVYRGRSKKTIVLVDLGVKHGILRNLLKSGYTLARLPHDCTADEIMGYDPVGVVYSNGPGNPNAMKAESNSLAAMLEYKLPVLGICLGHQLGIAALGGRITKMKYGHRAVNKAVVDMKTGRGYITTHNHGYACYVQDMPAGREPWLVSPDDMVVEGMRQDKLLSVQFHPESMPGTNDTHFIFSEFEKMVRDGI
jgi:carbamoyl-phosphate synthase small subunit